MYATQVFVEIILSREYFAGVALAYLVRTVEGFAFVLDLALGVEEASGVSEAGKLLAALAPAAVRALVLIHMFTKNGS